MKRVWALFGVGAACAACCAFPLALPMLAGVSMSALFCFEAMSWREAGVALMTVGLAMSTLAWARRRKAMRQAPSACAVTSCGCASSASPTQDRH